MQYLSKLCLISTLTLSAYSFANPSFLPADEAFQFSAESISQDQVQLKWKIAPHYYLYHAQFKVTANGNPVKFDLPKGEPKQDPTFGLTEVHYDQVNTSISVRPNTQYKVIWQGCAKDGLCYPYQNKTIQTDADGLLPQELSNASNSWGQKSSNSILNTQSNTEILQDSVVDDQNESNQTNQLENDSILAKSESSQTQVSSGLQWNDDQSFFNLLSKDSLIFNLFIFFLLGILLAFLPCSLPLIPILSTIIIQRSTGYKAVGIALSFILSMACVYSLMGIFVAEIGYSFQRWFQSPVIISLFAILFVVFALNLFGLFQLALPQAITQKLNRLQDKQKAGTILGSIGMGALSALIVGPCMSAPLAGALLFVSQSHSAVLGGLYLFILGLGIGLPLFIASVFGTKLLPKPGTWMNHLKVCFGFMMLMMAAYFIRPMLSGQIYAFSLAIICLALAIYLIKALKDSQTLLSKLAICFFIVISLLFSGFHISNGLKSSKIEHLQDDLITWTKASNLDQLNTAFDEAKQQNKIAIVDVYADWCVACQPLESEVFPRADVQKALQDFYLIKLDLSNYNESQDQILKEHEILGPPTLLIFNAQGHELRNLRLTGTFKAEQLLNKIESAKVNKN